MFNTVTVKGVNLGTGLPKVCVPIVGRTAAQILEETALLKTLNIDVVEWRVDFFENLMELDKVKEVLSKIHGILENIPIIFTCRSAKEGGETEVSEEYYFELNREIAKIGLADIIDIELFSNENEIRKLIEISHENSVYVIISNHDFKKTPPKEEIVSRLRKEQELGGDILKIAVMPAGAADVLTLLEATNTMKERYADRPMITISMSGIGLVTRLTGEIFGSALTFGAAKKVSAPGQIAANELQHLLSLLHENL